MQILKQDHQNESKSNGDSQTAERGEAMSHQINLERASVSGGQQQSNTRNKIMTVMKFIQPTMTTLLDYNELLKSQLLLT